MFLRETKANDESLTLLTKDWTSQNWLTDKSVIHCPVLAKCSEHFTLFSFNLNSVHWSTEVDSYAQEAPISEETCHFESSVLCSWHHKVQNAANLTLQGRVGLSRHSSMSPQKEFPVFCQKSLVFWAGEEWRLQLIVDFPKVNDGERGFKVEPTEKSFIPTVIQWSLETAEMRRHCRQSGAIWSALATEQRPLRKKKKKNIDMTVARRSFQRKCASEQKNTTAIYSPLVPGI